MKKKFSKVLMLLIVILLTTGCKNNLTRIEYKDINKMIKNKETFILVITQDNCSHCEEYTPRLKSILKKNNIEAYNLNITYIDQKDYNEFEDKYDFKGTPTTMFFVKGEEAITARIIGAVTNKKIESALKSQGYNLK